MASEAAGLLLLFVLEDFPSLQSLMYTLPPSTEPKEEKMEALVSMTSKYTNGNLYSSFRKKNLKYFVDFYLVYR